MSYPVSSFFNRLYLDVLQKGGIHTIGTKQVGKSCLKKNLSAYVMQEHPETKLIILDTEGSWEYEFNAVQFYRIINNDVSITEEITGQKLNGTNFTKKAYKIKESVKQDVINIISTKEPVLFIIELEEPEEIAYFSAFVIEHLYNLQRIRRKYWHNNIKNSYFLVLEECENIFSSHSLDKSQLNKLRKKYNELANLKIGILSSSQRLTEVDKKFRAKMAGYLVGHILPEDFIGIIQRALKLHMGTEAKKVTEPEFRYQFYYTGLNESFKVSPFQQVGEPFEVPRTRPTKPRSADQENKQEVKPLNKAPEPRAKKGTFQRFKDWLRSLIQSDFNPYDYPRKSKDWYPERHPEQTKQSIELDQEPDQELNPLLAETDEQLDESLFSDEQED